MTDEQDFIQQRLLQLGLVTGFTQRLQRVERGRLFSCCTYSGEVFEYDFDNLLLVTGRLPNDELFQQLSIDATRLGDCFVPSSIADAVYAGHRFAREFDEDPATLVPKRERARLQQLALDEITMP